MIVNARIAWTNAAARTVRQRITIAGMLTVNVSSNYNKLSRSLDQVGRKQLPFAFAKTLNQTMKAVGKYTVSNLPTRLRCPRPRLLQGLDVVKFEETRERCQMGNQDEAPGISPRPI